MNRAVVLAVAVVVLALSLAWTSTASPSPRHTSPFREVRCEACHTPNGWLPARFNHEPTGFPLRDRHVGVACARCHDDRHAGATPSSCAGCHTDVHRGEFGGQCRSCHDERAFSAPTFNVDAHRRTGFPLAGSHAVLRCEQCHLDAREHGAARAATTCASCHARAAARASRTTIDHRGLQQCQQCHQPVSFTPASLPAHEACFPIAAGSHAGLRCASCHTSTAGRTVAGGCDALAVLCASCHAHRAEVTTPLHKNVDGYAHRSARCLSCHRP